MAFNVFLADDNSTDSRCVAEAVDTRLELHRKRHCSKPLLARLRTLNSINEAQHKIRNIFNNHPLLRHRTALSHKNPARNLPLICLYPVKRNIPVVHRSGYGRGAPMKRFDEVQDTVVVKETDKHTAHSRVKYKTTLECKKLD